MKNSTIVQLTNGSHTNETDYEHVFCCLFQFLARATQSNARGCFDAKGNAFKSRLFTNNSQKGNFSMKCFVTPSKNVFNLN